MKTLAQIAQALKQPASNLTYYAKYYAEFLPKQTTEGKRWPMYEDEALQVFKAITEFTRKGLARGDVKKELSKKFEVVVDVESNKEPVTTNQQLKTFNYVTPALQQATITSLQQIAGLNETLSQQVEISHKLAERSKQSAKELQDLLEQRERELASVQTELEQEREEHKDTKRKLEKAREGGLLKRLIG